jgi:hypothetical protein
VRYRAAVFLFGVLCQPCIVSRVEHLACRHFILVSQPASFFFFFSSWNVSANHSPCFSAVPTFAPRLGECVPELGRPKRRVGGVWRAIVPRPNQRVGPLRRKLGQIVGRGNEHFQHRPLRDASRRYLAGPWKRGDLCSPMSDGTRNSGTRLLLLWLVTCFRAGLRAQGTCAVSVCAAALAVVRALRSRRPSLSALAPQFDNPGHAALPPVGSAVISLAPAAATMRCATLRCCCLPAGCRPDGGARSPLQVQALTRLLAFKQTI